MPELRQVPGGAVHEPWKLDYRLREYPPPIVDHDEERKEALARYAAIREHETKRPLRPPARRSTP